MGPENVPDMTVISDIDEGGINKNLQARYAKDLIYTYSGTILIAVNPYKELGIYTADHVFQYHGMKMGALEPHVFALAEAAYTSLQTLDTNQSCVISGESGAGKTETTKFILQYLCSVTSDVSTWVEQQILEANTILEAFGNAKTVRNDNSSRFGKFMQVCFNNKWMIRGCIIQDYLLEQSRITFQSADERNYHVFYQLVEGAGLNKELVEMYKLKPAEHFNYLNQSGCIRIEGVSDAHKFDALRLAFSVLRIPLNMCDGIFCVLSAILWLGNTKFQDIDGERCQLGESDQEILCTVAALLGLQFEDVVQVTLRRQINVRGNITEIPLKLQEAEENRHAMAKALYSRTFAWLVNHINICINPGQDSIRFLGVLDIFGFENFAINSFEQLCINYTNEKLHKFFNHYVFALEQEIYREEKIQFSHIQFTDNTTCLELIEKPPRCILKLLTEQCHMPKGSDTAYLNNLHSEFDGHSHYIKGEDRRKWEYEFGIRHYAGVVTYTVFGFVDKNRDVQQDVFFDFMSRSSNAFVQELTKYQDLLGTTVSRMGNAIGTSTVSRGTGKGKPTVSDTFRHQLQALVDVLQSTNPWYVRCIKPNMAKAANDYDEKLVLDQLKYLGMLEIIRIRKDGYPIHLSFADFLSRYSCVTKKKLPNIHRDAVQLLMRLLMFDPKEWQLGTTKVFMRHKVCEPIEELRSKILNGKSVIIQRNWKRYSTRKEFLRVRNAAIRIQNAYRGWKIRIEFLRKRRAVIVIQSRLRGMFAREVAAALREMRRVEEEMRKRERLEEEKRRSLEEECNTYNKEEEDIVKEVKQEKEKMMVLAEHLSSRLEKTHDSVDLDNLFAFLTDVQIGRNPIIDQIGEKMKELVTDIDMELENVLQQELESITNGQANISASSSSSLDLSQKVCSEKTTTTSTKGPSLPEPNCPPPPPPPPSIPNGIRPSEPIYEAVLPRDDENSSPLPTPPYKFRPKSPGLERLLRSEKSSPVLNGSPRHSRPNSRGSNVSANTPVQPWSYNEQLEEFEKEQRRKCRVEKKLQEMTIEKQEKVAEQPEEVHHDIMEFAQNYFNSHEKCMDGTIIATLTRKRKSIDFLPKYEMVTFNRISSIPTSHIHMYDPDNVTIACSIFRDFCKYMKGEIKTETEHQIIQTIIGYGIEREELRDEIYVQCMRQATNNPSVESTERAWLLLCLAIVAFQPSKLLHKYFLSFLKKNLQCDGKLRQYVQWCLDNCKNTKVSCRRYPPSTVEIAAMRRLGTIVCRFFFLDGRTKAIDIHPTDTASDAAAKLADKLGLHNLDGWAIYQSKVDGEEHVRGHDYLYDVIAAWEIKQNKQAEKPFAGLHRRSSSTTVTNGDNKFIFKKRLFRNSREISQDPVEISLLYAQAVYSVVKCDDFPINEKVAVQLAGLQAQVSLGDPKDSRLDYYTDIDSYLPYRISRSRGDDIWVSIIAQAHKQYGSGKSELIAKILYLTCVMQYKLYGSTIFQVSYRGYWSYGNTLYLGVNCEGLILIKPEDKLVLYEFQYPDIESIFLDPSDSFVTINLMRHHLDNETQKCFVFETNQKREIGSLIISYFPSLANWITESEIASKVVTGEDRARLYRALMECRRTLVDNGILNKSQDGAGKFFKNTLRRFSKNRIEKLWTENGFAELSETYHGFTFSYWAFSRQPLTQSICKLQEADELLAVQMFHTLLTYAGLHQNGEVVRRTEEEHVILIQSIMEKALRKDAILCELYMQLIKQTTEHPDPNSRVNLRHWAILSLACSVALPPQKNIRKYLLAHLRKCASDSLTEEGKYARFAEKCVSRIQGTRKRQWPPSKEEIMCTINRRLIYARFHFMDGQYHAIEFHSSASAADVVHIIKNKIGLRDSAMGYAIYEVLGNSERSLTSDEKVADIMSKWEHYRNANAAAMATSGSTSTSSKPTRKQTHLFLFKKHLFLDHFMDLNDPVEKELLYHQFLHALRSDRFPVTENEAIMLTALQAQVELGDFVEDREDYKTVAGHCLASRLAVNIVPDAVAMHQQSMRGMNSSEAKKSFLNLIRSWPFHRSTVFDVMQSFTSNWPKILWLAVDQVGLHLLEHRSRNALCSYEYDSILNYSPAVNCLMIITGSEKKQSKVILTTSQAFQIANLVKEYIEVLQAAQAHPKDKEMQAKKRESKRNSSARPVSILHKPASIPAAIE